MPDDRQDDRPQQEAVRRGQRDPHSEKALAKSTRQRDDDCQQRQQDAHGIKEPSPTWQWR
jgi:hypothetical protein